MHILINKKYLTYNKYKVKCAIGKRGIGRKRKEGDLITPIGQYKIKYILYRKDRIKKLKSRIKKIIIVRSVVPTRDLGFLPGTVDEKLSAFETPYVNMCGELFNDKGAYEQLKTKDQLEFLSTSYIRGMTFNNSILIIDECQNLTFHELDSIITRVGHNCRIIFAGDYYQSDFKQQKDKEGIIEFIDIIEQLNKFTIVEFDWKDIVRSDFVRDYIMTKEMIKR